MSKKDEVQGARSAATETYQIYRRGSEHRATRQFAFAVTCSGLP
jgi:hypothetical protein